MAGSSGSSGAQPLHEVRRRLDGHEIRLGEVPVVVGLLFRAACGERARPDVEVVGVLLDLGAGLPDSHLPRNLCVDPACDVRERVHVLDLAPGAQLVGARRAHGDVGVDAERALLHLRVRDPELDDRLPEELEEPLRLLRGVDVGRGDDLDERRPAAVVVDERVLGAADPARATPDVDVLRRVLLEVGTNDAYLMFSVLQWYDHVAVDARRQIVL